MGDHIERRRQQWYAVLDVPAKLQPVIGKKRLVQSLKTTSRAVAVDRARDLVGAWKRRFRSSAGASPVAVEEAASGVSGSRRPPQGSLMTSPRC
jgi:hypothetical protein